MSELSNSGDGFDKSSHSPHKSPVYDEGEVSSSTPVNQPKSSNSSSSSASEGSVDNKDQENEAEYFPQLSSDSSDVTEGNTLLGSISQSTDDSADEFSTKPNDPPNFQNIFSTKETDMTNNLSESSNDDEPEKSDRYKKCKPLPESSVSSDSNSRTSNKTGEFPSGLLTKTSPNRRCSKSPKMHAKRKISPLEFNKEYNKKSKGVSDDQDISSTSRKRKWKAKDAGKRTGYTKGRRERKYDNTGNEEKCSSSSKNILSDQTPNAHAVIKHNVQELSVIRKNNMKTNGNQPNESVEGDSIYTGTSSFSDTQDSNLIIDETGHSDSNVADDTSGNGQTHKSKEKSKPHDEYKEPDDTSYQLTISEREQFMTYLIQNLTCNLFYNTFCFSIPKGRETTLAYNCFVNEVHELLRKLVTNGDFMPSADLPLEKSVEKANRIVEDMRERYTGESISGTKEGSSKDNTQQTPEKANSDEVSETASKGSAEQTDSSTSGKSEITGNVNKLEKEVDNDLPQTAVFVVSDLTSSMKSFYAGQIVACVNPVSNIMSVSFFTYIPSYSDYIQDFISKRRMSEEMLEEISKNMEKFEISRQLRMDIPLNAIDGIHMYTESGASSPGFILLRITQEPQYFQRWVHSRTNARNKWQAREVFLPFICINRVPYTLFLGGNTDEISDIGAMIGRSISHLMIKPLLSNQTFSTILASMSSANNLSKRHATTIEMMNDEDWSQHAEQRTETVRRCCCLVDVLLKHKLVTPVQANELKLHLIDFRKSRNTRSSRLMVRSTLNDIPLQACLRDYIFKCDSAEELEKHLSTHLTAVALKENRLTDIPETELNLSAMTVVDFLNIEQYYYSFCLEKLASLDDYQHCPCCRTCTLPCVSHFLQNLFHSNKPFCSNCGMVGEDAFLIMPKSLSPNQLAFAKDVTEERSIQDVQTDLISFPDPCEDLQNLQKSETVFKLDDVMCDPFGLSDPVAFLLGSEARGIDSQQGRCRQKYRRKEKPDGNALPCSVQ